MTLRKKALLILGTGFILLAAAVFVGQNPGLFGRADGAGMVEMERKLGTVVATVRALLVDMDTRAGELAASPQARLFLDNPRLTLVARTLLEPDTVSVAYDFAAVEDARGDILAVFDWGREGESGLATAREVIEGARSADTRGPAYEGAFPVPGGLALIAGRGVADPAKPGNFYGSIVLGMYLGAEELRMMGGELGVSLTARGAGERAAPPDFAGAFKRLKDGSGPFAEGMGRGRIGAYALLGGLGRSSGVIIRAVDTRGEGALDPRAMARGLVVPLAVLLGTILLIYVLLEWLVFSRISRLQRTVDDIGALGDVSSRVDVGGDDEIATLGSGINAMLDEIDRPARELTESREHAASIFNRSSDPIIIHDLEGRITDVNERAEQTLGRTREELLALNMKDLVSPHSLAGGTYDFEGILGTGTSTFETGMKTSGGAVLPVGIEASRFEAGGVAMVQASVRDLSAAKAARRRIESLERMTYGSVNPVISVSRDMVVLDANGAAGPLLNDWRCGVGEKIPQGARPDHVSKLVAEVLASGKRKEVEYTTAPPKRVFALSFLPGEDGETVELHGSEITRLKKNEEALKRSVALQRASVDSTAAALLVVGAGGRVEHYNQAFLQMWKVPAQVLDTVNEKEYMTHFYGLVEDPDAFYALIKEAYARPDAVVEDEVRLRDGRIIHPESRPRRVGRETTGRVWTFLDVTARARAEAGMTAALDEVALREVKDGLLEGISKAIEGGEGVQRVMEMAAGNLCGAFDSIDRVLFYAPDGAGAVLLAGSGLGPGLAERSTRVTGPGGVVLGTLLDGVPRVSSGPGGDETSYLERELGRGYVCLPLNANGSVTAAMAAFSLEHESIDDPVIDVLERVARQLSMALAAESLEHALAEETKGKRRYADSVHVMIWETDGTGSYIYFNKAWYEFTGRTEEYETGSGWMEGIHPDDAAEFMETSRMAMQSGKALEAEIRLRHRSGEFRRVRFLGSPLGDRGAESGGYSGTCVEVLEIVLPDPELELRDARLMERSITLQQMASKRDGAVQEQLKSITETGCRTLGVSRTGIWIGRDDLTRLVCLDIYEGASDEHSANMEMDAAAHPEYFGALRAAGPIVAHSIAAEPAYSGLAEGYFSHHGIRSALEVPVMLGGAPAGMVRVETRGEERRWLGEDVSFVASLAARASVVIEAFRRRMAEHEISRERERVRETEAYSEAVFESLTDGVLVVDAAGKIGRLNSAARFMLSLGGGDAGAPDTLPRAILELVGACAKGVVSNEITLPGGTRAIATARRLGSGESSAAGGTVVTIRSYNGHRRRD